MNTRDDLIRQINDEHAAWQELVAEVGADRMEQPGAMGDWTFKDLTAHLTAWTERTIARVEAGPDATLPTPWPASMDTDDEINGWIYEQNRDRPLRDVLAEADRSYERLAAAIATVPEADLTTPGRFRGLEDKAFVDADLFGHLHEEHEPALRAWLQSR